MLNFLLSSSQAILIERWTRENALSGEKRWKTSKHILSTHKLTRASSRLLFNMAVILTMDMFVLGQTGTNAPPISKSSDRSAPLVLTRISNKENSLRTLASENGLSKRKANMGASRQIHADFANSAEKASFLSVTPIVPGLDTNLYLHAEGILPLHLSL